MDRQRFAAWFTRIALIVFAAFAGIAALPTHPAAAAGRPQLLLTLRGEQVTALEKIVTRPERPASSVESAVVEMYQGGKWYFFDNGNFAFIPPYDAENPVYGTYSYDSRAATITFRGGRTVRTSTYQLSHGISGTIQADRNGPIAQVSEEVSSVSAAVMNGQSFGQNKYRSSTATIRMSVQR